MDELRLVIAPVVAEKDCKPRFMDHEIMSFGLIKAEHIGGNLIMKYRRKLC